MVLKQFSYNCFCCPFQNDLLEQQKLQAQAMSTSSQATPLVPSHPPSLSPAQSPQSTPPMPSAAQPSTQQTTPTALLSGQVRCSSFFYSVYCSVFSQAPTLSKPQASPSAAGTTLSPTPQPPLLPANLQASGSPLLPTNFQASGGPQPSLLPANLQATASLLQSLTSGQTGAQSSSPLSLPHLLPLNPSVLQTIQGSNTSSNLLQVRLRGRGGA